MCTIANHFQINLRQIFLWTILFFLFENLHAQQFKDYTFEGLISPEISSDSVAPILNSRYHQAIAEQDTSDAIRSLLSMSALERKQLNYMLAVNHSGEALFLAGEYKNARLLARAHEEFGVLNYLFKQDDEAGANFKRSYTFYRTALHKGQVTPAELYAPYYNLLLYYQRIENAALLTAYADSCRQLTEAVGIENSHTLFLTEKSASLLMKQGQHHQALPLLAAAAHELENLAKSGAVHASTKSFLIILYAQIAQCYQATGQAEQAKSFFQKSLLVEDTNGEHTFYRAYVYRRYAQLLFEDGDSRKAFVNLMLANDINERYLNPRNENTQGFLSLKNPYLEELQKKNKELNANKLALAESTGEALRFRISFFITLFLLISAGLIILIRVQRLKHLREKAKNEEEQHLGQMLLEEKNKELTTNTLQLIEKEELIKTLSELISRNPTDDTSKKILSNIEKRSGNLWESFNARFVSQNENFYERLQAKVPDLSSTDLKICALIKLNFSGKEMAYLLGISLGSVHVARHRIRKKLNLERDVNLTSYINAI
ncbi:hypothetical protein [Mangrovibacterium sp.]|uniref:hypothetical protein n=1 Tax=Mangrovibacterium sp. TaxID=1961364 RepID=UPI00356606A3